MKNKFNILANVFALGLLLVNGFSFGIDNFAINWYAYVIGAIYAIGDGIWWYRKGKINE